MIVTCPSCGRQHQVKPELAGKRAKCSCGQILTIPAADNTAAPPDDLAGVSPQPQSSAAVIVEYRYGEPQRKFWILMAGSWFFGIGGIPMTLFGSEGWGIGRAPLPTWCMMMVFGLLTLIFLSLAIYYTGSYFFQRKHPQRVAVTATGMIVPKGRFSTAEHVIPFSEMRLKIAQAGPFLITNVKHSKGRTQLHSGLFPSDEAAETFAEHLQERVS